MRYSTLRRHAVVFSTKVLMQCTISTGHKSVKWGVLYYYRPGCRVSLDSIQGSQGHKAGYILKHTTADQAQFSDTWLWEETHKNSGRTCILHRAVAGTKRTTLWRCEVTALTTYNDAPKRVTINPVTSNKDLLFIDKLSRAEHLRWAHWNSFLMLLYACHITLGQSSKHRRRTRQYSSRLSLFLTDGSYQTKQINCSFYSLLLRLFIWFKGAGLPVASRSTQALLRHVWEGTVWSKGSMCYKLRTT